MSLLQSVDVLGLGFGPNMEKKLKYAEYVSSGIVFGKELVNSPANILTPGSLLSYALISTTYFELILSINFI